MRQRKVSEPRQEEGEDKNGKEVDGMKLQAIVGLGLLLALAGAAAAQTT
jgi:hypothetical protein